ncbi:hypothetical protein OHA25_38660 [Nonomuraea sp. NBC_00507]|uniref:CocE/NonD family hydrolase C-terminal non-catalytic domain-containing protein n=1 Tax=Nonomuraea sp. NBC_00507 TaxID=2976002 RepID=UPI002E17E9B6
MDTDFHLRADGRLTHEPPSTAEQPEEFTYDPMDPVPTTGGALFMSDDFRPGPLDQTAVEAREDVLVFTTEPLAEDVEVTGRVRAVLFATDGPSTDWVACLGWVLELPLHCTPRQLEVPSPRVKASRSESVPVSMMAASKVSWSALAGPSESNVASNEPYRATCLTRGGRCRGPT